MDVREALYTTRMMRRMHPDPIPAEVQARILDAAIRAPNGGNTQRWHFLLVDAPDRKAEIKKLYQECRELEYQEFTAGSLGATRHDQDAHAATIQRIRISGDRFVEGFTDIPLLMFVFAIDDHGGANIYPAVWSLLLAARAEGVGGVLTTLLRYRASAVHDLLGVPAGEGWSMISMLALGYPRGRWGVAADRRPVPEVCSRNRWGGRVELAEDGPLWSPPDHGGDA